MTPRHATSCATAFLAAAIAVIVAIAAPHARAQAISTASKSASIDIFGGFVDTAPDYSDQRDTGGAIGVDYTRYFHLPVHIAVEARANSVSGSVVNERTVLGGIKLGRDYRRFTPYADFLIGIGTIKYAVPPIPGYTSDRGRTYSYGGGVDIPVYKTFSVKADFQLQSWNLGVNSITRPQGGDYTLSPTMLTLGINYRIPFRPHFKD